MKAIVAKYYGPTDFKGARIKVWAEGCKPVFYAYAYEQSDGGKEAYITDYARNMGWYVQGIEIAFGGLPDGSVVGVFYWTVTK